MSIKICFLSTLGGFIEDTSIMVRLIQDAVFNVLEAHSTLLYFVLFVGYLVHLLLFLFVYLNFFFELRNLLALHLYESLLILPNLFRVSVL